MHTVTKRELNQRTADVLAVAATEPVVVTERGVPRWRVEAITAHPDPIERLRADGRITPAAKRPVPWPPRDHSGRTPDQVDALFNELRGDH
jgi:antitoxin (DNA-binding transcriptional repressor) of toxin-antitoxin stability system